MSRVPEAEVKDILVVVGRRFTAVARDAVLLRVFLLRFLRDDEPVIEFALEYAIFKPLEVVALDLHLNDTAPDARVPQGKQFGHAILKPLLVEGAKLGVVLLGAVGVCRRVVHDRLSEPGRHHKLGVVVVKLGRRHDAQRLYGQPGLGRGRVDRQLLDGGRVVAQPIEAVGLQVNVAVLKRPAHRGRTLLVVLPIDGKLKDALASVGVERGGQRVNRLVCDGRSQTQGCARPLSPQAEFDVPLVEKGIALGRV
jgi:hypothetical protein